MKGRIAFIVQRYGKEVNGGAEVLSMQLAEHLSQMYDVEVITTKAIDYITWQDEYADDVEQINGITVRRFGVEQVRDIKAFSEFSPTVIVNSEHTAQQEEEWIDRQGPYSPALIKYIENNADNYDVFIFMTYLYYTTVKGLPLVSNKAILIPTAHDESPIYLEIFKKIFNMPKALYYLTYAEKKFVEALFGNSYILNNGGIGGCGIEVPCTVDKDRLKREKNISSYMVYAGRIDEGKGCVELFEFFLRYKEQMCSDLKLVMIGKKGIQIPDSNDIIYLGFVSEQEKYDIMAGAKFLVLPSSFESLSIVVLEAMALSVPVLIKEKCSVLKEHCLRSNAGLYYRDYYEFERCIRYMLSHKKEMAVMGQNGVKYVNENYNWNVVMDKFVDIIGKISQK